MDILPVINGFIRLLGVIRDAVTQMHGKLSDISKSSLVSDLLHARKTHDLSRRVFHQVDALYGMHAGLSASLHEPGIQCLYAHLLHTLITNDSGLADNEESGDSGSFIGAVC